jgi:uncharacterized protein
MRDWKRMLTLAGIVLVVLGVIYVAFFLIFLELVVDFWWFRSLNFEGYFWLKLLYRYIISGGVTLLFFLIFFINFWIGSRFVGFQYEAMGRKEQEVKQTLLSKFQTGALEVYIPLSLILAIVIALPFYHQWNEALLFIFAPDAGIKEPVYGNDVGFYMFSYPIYQLIQRELLITFSLLFLSMLLLYWIEHRLLAAERKEYPLGARIHLNVLIVIVILIVTWGFMLQRFSLLYVDAHEPVFYGPGFVDLRYDLPLIWLAMITFIGTAVSAIFLIQSHGHKGRKPLIGFGLSFLLMLGLRAVDFIPELITKFYVLPNPVKAEGQFMANNVKATLDAYRLNDVKSIDFEVTLRPEEDLAEWVDVEHLQSIPVWDRQLLDDVYYQLQGLRPYYQFPTVDEDRYTLEGYLQQVNLAAREVNIANLPPEAHTWENKYLRYTHGYGAVMTPAAQDGGQPIQWYLRDLNMYSSVGLTVEQPDIYYGLEKTLYALVPNELTIVGIAGTDPEAMKNYTGKGGVPIASLFRKLLLAIYFKDVKLFFSTNVNAKTKALFRRNITERIETLTPFLALDEDPYLVLTPESFYWIQDAYTLTDSYPVSKLLTEKFKSYDGSDERHFNYIRNSVKIMVNAYDGTIDYYIVDPEDPIIQGYNRAYPGLFKTMEQMPADLKSHIRYPRDLFYLQLRVYAKYHQKRPEMFYQQAETWQFAKRERLGKVGPNVVMPYYLTTELQDCPELTRFVLIDPMTPIGRENLSVLAIAGSLSPDVCTTDYTQKIVMYKFTKDVQVNGPAQVAALIDQDPLISEQFTLWDQHGSQVRRGRMVILPVASSMLYVQPVYMISTHTKIPELVRIIVGMGNVVVMEKSLAEGFRQLEAKLRKDRAAPRVAPPPTLELSPDEPEEVPPAKKSRTEPLETPKPESKPKLIPKVRGES